MTEPRELPVSFASFVVSLASSAMMHLGEAPDPSTGDKAVDLGLATHTVRVLQVLSEKTAGNLDDDERQLLDTVLADLGQRLEAHGVSAAAPSSADGEETPGEETPGEE